MDYVDMATEVINVASVPHRSPFRYPGGKTWLVPYVRYWLNDRSKTTTFIEPFAGGAIVGLSVIFEGLAEALEIVELDEDVASVWETILNGKGVELANQIARFQPTYDSVQKLLNREPLNKYQRAFATIVKNRVRRGGILASGASLIKAGENGKGLCSRWYPATLQRRILEITANKENIKFKRGDGIEYIRKRSDAADSCFFVDPPYTVAARRLYAHSEIDHELLFRTLSSVRGDFLMTYDNAPAIKDLALKYDLDAEEVLMKNTHHKIMSELLIGRSLDWLRRLKCSQLQSYSILECV